jgi:hypothetical protein
VILAAGLGTEDVSMSSETGGRAARILVHMRQASRLLRALNVQQSQIVGSRKALSADKQYRVNVNLPHAVVGAWPNPACLTHFQTVCSGGRKSDRFMQWKGPKMHD